MTEAYQKMIDHYDDEKGNEYFGVIGPEGNLVGYIYVAYLEEAAFVYKILGHQGYLEEGIMYLLLTHTIFHIIGKRNDQLRNLKYIFYDSFLHNKDGLILFKKRFGFIPYRIKWFLK